MMGRAAAARPGCAGLRRCRRGVHVMPGCHRQAQGSRPASASAWFVPVHVCRWCGLPSPCQSAPGSPSVGFIDRRFRLRITAGYICGKRSAYLCAIAAWHVDNSAFFLHPQGVDRVFPGEGPVTGAARQHDPQHFPMCAQARRRFAQVIHMVVHSKACNTFSCQAGRQSGSACRCLREAAGTQDADLAWAWMTSPTTAGTGCSPHCPAGQAARAPRRLPAVTLIVILPAARPRHPQAARAQSPPALVPPPARPRPRAAAGGAGPHRRPGSAADHRPATADAGALAPEASLLATARHPVLRARTARVLHGPVADAAAPRLPPRPGAAAREPRPCSAGPQIIAAGIPALRVPALAKTFLPGRIRQGPSMYEMEGPCPASPRRPAS